MRSAVICCLGSLLAGCLDPLVSDDLPTTSLILPAGTLVPSALDDPAVVAQITAADGLAGIVPRQTAFVGGQRIFVWNVGPAPAVAAPLFVLAKRNAAGELEKIAHPTVIEAIPGDPRYSPFWAVFFVEVTAAYRGELLTSFAAVSEAVDRGLVKRPAAQTFAVNCPIAGPDVRLEVGAGMTAGPGSAFYYEGTTVPYFDFGPMPLVDGSAIPEARRIVVRRAGEEEVSEVSRHVDLTSDGDTIDTNDILEGAAGITAVTPRMRTVTVAVPASTALIDTSHDETVSDLKSSTQLFAPGPTSLVVGYTPTGEIANWVAQSTSGGL